MTLEIALSLERLNKYDAWAGNNRAIALELYASNLAISEAFYTSLHVLEITLRNAVHNRMSGLHGPYWFQNTVLVHDFKQRAAVADALRKLGGTPTAPQVIAELTFGFWTGLFDKKNQPLWGQDLRPIFQAGVPLQRKTVAKRLYDIRTLRNRIAHHESIIQLDLQTIHLELCEILGWLSVDALAWANNHSRFHAVHPQMPIIVGNLVNPVIDFCRR